MLADCLSEQKMVSYLARVAANKDLLQMSFQQKQNLWNPEKLNMSV